MTLAEGTRSLAAYIGIRRETPGEFQARKIELSRRQEAVSRHLEQTSGVFIDDAEDELYLEEHRERLRRELRQIVAESRAKSPKTELVASVSPAREAKVVLPEALVSPGQTFERLARGAVGIVGKVVIIQTETPAQAARRRFLLRREVASVVNRYEFWDDALSGELSEDDGIDVQGEVDSLRARRDELIPEVLKGPTIRTEVVLFGGKLGRFGRRTLYEDTRANTPRLEPIRIGRIHPVPEG